MVKKWQYQTHTEPVSLESERITVDKWFVETNRPRFDIARNQYLYPSRLFDILDSSVYVNPNCGWGYNWGGAWGICGGAVFVYFGFTNNVIRYDVKRLQYTYPSLFYDTEHLNDLETITIDKWFTETSKPRFDTRRNQHLYPNRLFDVLESTVYVEPPTGTVTLDQWYRELSTPRFDIKRNRHLYPTLIIPVGYLLPEQMDVDKWFVETSRPRFDVGRFQYLFPSFFIDIVSALAAEEITLDKWFVETSKPRFDKKRNQYLYSETFRNNILYPLGVPEVPMDSWWINTNLPQFDIHRLQYLYPTLFPLLPRYDIIPSMAFTTNIMMALKRYKHYLHTKEHIKTNINAEEYMIIKTKVREE